MINRSISIQSRIYKSVSNLSNSRENESRASPMLEGKELEFQRRCIGIKEIRDFDKSLF